MVGTVVFDIGETLFDETAVWSALAARAGVTRLTLFGLLGALIDERRSHRHVWELLDVEPPRFEHPGFTAADLYPDALPCLRSLRELGLRTGIVGNQPAAVEDSLRRIGLPVDFLAVSDGWGVAKPAPAFFERVCAEAGAPAAEIAYVGDRVDNDILPARRAGMVAVFLRRGPWGYLHARLPEAQLADLRIETLAELPGALRRHRDLAGGHADG